MQMKRRQDEVCTERESQIRTKEEVRRMKEEEDRLFAQMWESDRLAKEERHNQEVQRQRENNLQQKTFLQTQMETAEQQRVLAKQLKQEEAQLLVLIFQFNESISQIKLKLLLGMHNMSVGYWPIFNFLIDLHLSILKI